MQKITGSQQLIIENRRVIDLSVGIDFCISAFSILQIFGQYDIPMLSSHHVFTVNC